jgi:hypothetical protein
MEEKGHVTGIDVESKTNEVEIIEEKSSQTRMGKRNIKSTSKAQHLPIEKAKKSSDKPMISFLFCDSASKNQYKIVRKKGM